MSIGLGIFIAPIRQYRILSQCTDHYDLGALHKKSQQNAMRC